MERPDAAGTIADFASFFFRVREERIGEDECVGSGGKDQIGCVAQKEYRENKCSNRRPAAQILGFLHQVGRFAIPARQVVGGSCEGVPLQAIFLMGGQGRTRGQGRHPKERKQESE